MRKLSVFIGLCLIGIISNVSSANVPSVTSSVQDHIAVFEKMKNLAGTYIELAEPKDSARVEYRLISRGSALMETWSMPGGKQELTVFHMDNGTLIATHYCAAGMQSTMQLVSQTADGLYNFRLRSITNQPTQDASHNSGFGYDLTDLNMILRNEVWTIDGKESISDLRLKRNGGAGV